MVDARSERGTDVLLVNMPFGILVTPSLALGLLQASLAGLPVRSRQRYFSLSYCHSLGFVGYQEIANRWGSGHEELGEWVFAQALSPDEDLQPERYVERILRRPPVALARFLRGLPEDRIQIALEARRLVEPFLDACLAEIVELRPKIVAFSAMFQQRVASLALARRIKQHLPDTFVVMGGADCDPVRGRAIAESFPFVDAVVSGPGDAVFPEVVQRVLAGRSLVGMPGVLTRGAPSLGDIAVAPGVPDLDRLPYPEFGDYFSELEASGLKLPVLYLSLETSRGCWWGEKNHCTFCSINGASMAYASKSAERVVAEIQHFARTYPGVRIVMTDSILNVRHLDQAMPTLAKSGLELDMMYEVRASLTLEQIETLHACGVRTLQPGIESLSTAVLKLIRKRTSYLVNVRLLKFGRMFDIAMFWNLLMGFPDEPPEAYAEMARLVPLLVHLEPPKKLRVIEIGRNSPLFEEAEAFGVIQLEPSPAYRYIYPFAPAKLRQLATYYTHSLRSEQRLDVYAAALAHEVERWWQVGAESKLEVVYEADRSVVRDTRPAFGNRSIVLEDLEHELHRACEDIVPLKTLEQRLAHLGTRAEVSAALAALAERGLLVSDEDRWLALAVPVRASGARATKNDGQPSNAEPTALGLR